MNKIEPFFVPAEHVSPGGKDAIGLRVNGQFAAWCIGSGESPRHAKACAIKHVRQLLRGLKNLNTPPKL